MKKRILTIFAIVIIFIQTNGQNNTYVPAPFVPILDNNTYNLLWNRLSNLEAMYGTTVDEMKIYLGRDEEYIRNKLQYTDFAFSERKVINNLVTVTYKKPDNSCLIMYGIYDNSCAISSFMYKYNEEQFNAIRNKFNNSSQWKKIGFDNWQIIIGNIPSFKVELKTINDDKVICLDFQN